MASSIVTVAEERFPRSTTPRARPSSVRIITKSSSYQALVSPVLASPAANIPFSPASPDWPAINLISPSTASHHSVPSDTEEDGDVISPRLALLTSGLSDETGELNKLISPSAPIPQPGDELLYDVAIEEKPDVAFFNPDFQASLTKTKLEMKDVSLAVWGCPASHQLGSDLYALRQRADQLGEFEPMRTRRLALVGDEGNGKAAAINALLDESRLNHSSFDDDSPAIVTEYWFRPAHLNEPFAVEVDYLNVEEIRELIQELLRTFRMGQDPAVQDIDDLKERTDVRHQGEKAWHTLHAMFRNQQFFTKEFLLRYPPNGKTALVDVLHHWALEFLATRPGGGKCRTWSTAAFDAEECCDRLDAFTSSPVDQSTPALWPFVRLARVYLRSPILHSGIVLVDCPSPRDLDYARARTVERHLRSCHEIFIVTPREAALDDQCVSDIVERIGHHRRLSIVCTNTEVVSVRGAERNDPEVSLQVRTWRQQVETLRMQAKRSEAQRRHGLPGALQDEARNRDLLEEMEFGLKQFLVQRRNAQVANCLIDKFAGQVQLGDLKVFCVSSRDYWEHRYDEQERAISRLDLSGIVDLRRYCHEVAADVQFEEAAAFMEHEVPAFLGSLKMWAAGCSEVLLDDKKEQVQLVMKNLEGIAVGAVMPTAPVQVAKGTLAAEFGATIVLPIRDQRSEWRNAALDASKEWTKWNAKDYMAFCRHHGAYTTPSTGPRNWNEALTQPMRAQLTSKWTSFEDVIKSTEDALIDSIDQVFDSIGATLKANLSGLPASTHTLLEILHHRAHTLHHLVRIIFTSLLEATASLALDTLHGHLTSTISTLMTPAYHAATALLPSTYSPITAPAKPDTLTPPHSPFPSVSSPSPSLLDQQRKDLVTGHIASARLFSRMAVLVEKAQRAIVREAWSDLLNGFEREIGALIRDFGMVGRGEEGKFVDFARGLETRIERAGRVVAEGVVVVEEVRREYGETDEREDEGADAENNQEAEDRGGRE